MVRSFGIIWFILFVSTGPVQSQLPGVLTGKYIVAVHPQFSPLDVALTHGLFVEHSYEHAFHGFATSIPLGKVRVLIRDPRILAIEPDVPVKLMALLPPLRLAPVSAPATDIAPSGVKRIGADQHPLKDVSSVGIAILDTGIAVHHPDLNIAGQVSFVRGNRSGNDDHGHGTHVAGIAAAKINGIGIRGVAPNARLYALKVLDDQGNGTLSTVLAGIDWLTKYARTFNIKIANISFGFPGTSSILNSAISKSVAAGVAYVVAAGNESRDASQFSPSNHPHVITVSAIADSDGACGGTGPGTPYGSDDAFAAFSNFGSVIDVAAPGVNIYSTTKNGGYTTLSGTSMAAPHVTGVAALYLASHPQATPFEIYAALVLQATPQSARCASGSPHSGGFRGDPDSTPEPLINALIN